MRYLLAAFALATLTLSAPERQSDDGLPHVVDFNRHIRPILSENCFTCHGPDKDHREADIRLDTGESWSSIVVPREPAKSKLFMRISSTKRDFKMPPSGSGKHLTPGQIALIRKWIEQGAAWQPHWSFAKIERPKVPDVRNAAWPRHEIDRFVLARLEKEGLDPSREAVRPALIRRLSLDLTGIPPTPAEVEAFLADKNDDAYEKLVDRLLASPRFGERMAMDWLDLARYADTHGYSVDSGRDMWAWRDWVIHAFNRNMPYDRFTVEQLAGDLLPEPTRDQLVATGFNRNHAINFEGGAFEEEYHVEYVVDRVNTTSQVWMGLTMGCARCHEHKYDPISNEEFYRFYAFFNSIDDKGLDGQTGNATPFIKLYTAAQERRLAEIRERVKSLEAKLTAPDPEIDARQAEWEAETAKKLQAPWTVLDPVSFKSSGGATLTEQADHSILASGKNPDKDEYEVVLRTDRTGIGAIRLEVLTDDSLSGKGPGRADNGNFVLTEVQVDASSVKNPVRTRKVEFAAVTAPFSQSGFDISQTVDGKPETGWAGEGYTYHAPRVAVFVPKSPIGFKGGTDLRVRLKHLSQFPRHAIGRFRFSITTDEMKPSTLGPWSSSGPFTAEDGQKAFATEFKPESWTARPEFADGKAHNLTGQVAATYLRRTITAPSARFMTISVGSDDGIRIRLNDQLVLDRNIARVVAPDQDRVTLPLQAGENTLLMKVVNFGGGYAFYFRPAGESTVDLPMDVFEALSLPGGPRAAVRDYFRRTHSPEWQKANVEVEALRKEDAAIEAAVPTTMVMKERGKPRETFILKRGQYDQPGTKVAHGTPACLPPLPRDAPMNRLGLARWLVDPSHPLTSRVAVNRLWQMVFGVGLVETSEDFGAQGQPPSHPELLDWLAAEFIASGWDVKAMLKKIVTSATYRQSSTFLAKDPKNRLLARGPRFRMPAEMLRDNALAISGLLHEKIGGPSVKPYQPPGLWDALKFDNQDGQVFSAQVYQQDKDAGLYRRSMYIFWKRSIPHPEMTTLDAPNREVCLVRRQRTNTPLQALMLLNDTTFVEAARSLAQIAMTALTPEERAALMFRRATARRPAADEIEILLKVYREQLAAYQKDKDAAARLLKVGESKPDGKLDPCELAAWTIVASMILNLDETITKG